MLQMNTGNLYKVLKDFYTLTRIRIVLFDSDFTELISYPAEQIGFCARIRKNIEINAECVNCDRVACQKCAKTKELILYRCHMGLLEAVVPIYDNNGIMGYAMFGQILPEKDFEQTRQKLKRQFEQKTFPGIEKEIDQISAKSSAELNAIATILQALVAYVLSNQWVTPGKAEFIRRLDRYIEEHMGTTITVENLCEDLHLGRTKLYNLAENYLGCGIAEYIRHQRIKYAEKLLTETEMSVGDVAYAAGFSDYTHFFRTFKKISGVSAREFRKNNGKKRTENSEKF